MYARNPLVHFQRPIAAIMRGAFLLLSLVLLLPSFSTANVRISVDSTSLNFGSSTLMQTVDRTIHIMNTSTSDVEVDNLTIGGGAGGDYSIISPPAGSFPVVVPAGSSSGIMVILRFAPKLTGSRPALLTIETSDGSIDIPMTGSGVGNQGTITFAVKTVDFGRIAPNASHDSTIWVYSSGTGSATITGVQVNNGSGNSDFVASLVKPSLTLPIELPVGDSLGVVITFSGSLPEEIKTGSLIVYGDVGGGPSCDLMGEVKWGSGDFSLPKIDFGDLYVGEVRDTTIDFQNSGDVDISLIDVQLNSATFSEIPKAVVPLTIKAGEKYTFTIRANPPAVGLTSTQLQTLSRTTVPTFRSIDVMANVFAMPLTLLSGDTIRGSCATPGMITYSRTVVNSAPRDYAISSLLLEDAGVALTMPVTPLIVAAGASQVLAFAVDPATVPARGYFVVDYLGGDIVLFRDTVVVQLKGELASTAIEQSTISTWKSKYRVSMSALSSTVSLSTITIDLRSSESDRLAIERASIAGEGVFSGAGVTISPQPDGYTVTLSTSAPVSVGPAMDILSFTASEFVSSVESATITSAVQAPELSGCLDFTTASILRDGSSECGATTVQSFLRNGSIRVTGVRRADRQHLELGIASSFPVSTTVAICNAGGTVLRTPDLEIARGDGSYRVDISALPAGPYFLIIRSSEAPPLSVRFTK
jgi:hypothetical protein